MANGDQKAEFKVGDKSVNLNVQDWTGFVGQWDDRTWKTTEEPIPQRGGSRPQGNGPRVRSNEYGEMIGIRPGYIKRADIGWFASHRHDAAASNEPYAYSYLFAYAIDVPLGTSTFTLPRNHNIRILAATAANQNAETWSTQPLGPRAATQPKIEHLNDSSEQLYRDGSLTICSSRGAHRWSAKSTDPI